MRVDTELPFGARGTLPTETVVTAAKRCARAETRELAVHFAGVNFTRELTP